MGNENGVKITLDDVLDTLKAYAIQNEVKDIDINITVDGIDYSIMYRDERAEVCKNDKTLL